MTISAIAEPALMLAVFTVALGAGSTNLSVVAHRPGWGQSWRFLAPPQMLAFAALFIVLIAETGRIPVDNPATHLELTMIHEAMILEYSGPYLALIEWSAAMKLAVFLSLIANVFAPWGIATTLAPAAMGIGLVALPIEDRRACGADRDPGVHVRKIAVVPRDGSPGRRLYPGAPRAVVLLHSSELSGCRFLLTLDRNSSTYARPYSC